jgi:hypothetical protein
LWLAVSGCAPQFRVVAICDAEIAIALSRIAEMGDHHPVGLAAFVQCEKAGCISANLLYLRLQQ